MVGDRISVKPCDINIKKILHLTDEMIELAEIGDAQREDTGCGILYGMLLDSAYKLKRLAEKEKERHINKGWWKNDIE
jgi:sulfopyruvate decarboxylase TPP-binding subunit